MPGKNNARNESPGQNPGRKHPPIVNFGFPRGFSFFERMRTGIIDYAQARGGWQFSLMPETIAPPSIEWLKHMRFDGAFVYATTTRDLRVARTLRFPIVNLADHVDPSAIPSVLGDHRRIGQMAAGHLLGLGFARLGYFGPGYMWYSVQRHAGFADAARQAGAQCHSLLVQPSQHPALAWRNQHRQLERWLRGLRPPIGIMASMDLRAAMIVNMCSQIGLRVPDDVAVLGVDNDQTICDLGSVPLTSIARNDWKAGWEAAAMLDRLMAGKTISTNPVLIEPERVVVRKSTETMPVDDPFLARLIADARTELGKPFGVEWFVQRSGCSRSWLERHFRAELGHPPLTILNRLRVARAREILSDAGRETLSLSAIAAQCGFADLRRFRLVFTKHMGATPKQFRRAAHKTAPKGKKLKD